MNRSWTHKNIARSVQFGGVYPIYQGGSVHRKLDTSQANPSAASGGEQFTEVSSVGYVLKNGGSWRNTKKLAVSWTVHTGGATHSISFFHKGHEYSLTAVPSNYFLKAVSINKQFLILLFVSGAESSGGPVLMRKYTSFLAGVESLGFSEILQAEMSFGSAPSFNTGFTQDGRTFGVFSNDLLTITGQVYRFSADFSSYSETTLTGLGSGRVYAACIDGLGFSVCTQFQAVYYETPVFSYTVEDCPFPYELIDDTHTKIFSVQPSWGEGVSPYIGDPLSWGVSTIFNNIAPEHTHITATVTDLSLPFEGIPGTFELNDISTDQTDYVLSYVYSDKDGVLIFTYGGSHRVTTGDGTTSKPLVEISFSATHQMFLELDGTTYVLKSITGANTEYVQSRFTRGLILPGTDILYARWAFPNPSGASRDVFEVHIDLKTRVFTFHEHPVESSTPLALTSL